jgi:hypothetical protein
MATRTATLQLPLDLQVDQDAFAAYLKFENIVFLLSDSYLTTPVNWENLPEVVCIQRLLTMSQSIPNIQVVWESGIALEAFRAPSIFPFLATLLCLEDITHKSFTNNTELDTSSARRKIYGYQFSADLFSDVQILLCADNRGQGRPSSLYSSESGDLITRDSFETLVDLLLSSHRGYGAADSQALFYIKAIGTIVAELFENTELHGRLGLDGRQIKKNGIRGLFFKRVKITKAGEWKKFNQVELLSANSNRRDEATELDALEVSIFDAGVGYYSAYTKINLVDDTDIKSEWAVVHQCLQRHYDDRMDDTRPSHRAMGLYEVLRALTMVKGLIEVRSGRVYGFRTFVPGELRFQLEPADSPTRPNMPKPFLLDSVHKFVRKPTAHESLIGTSIRVLIPL